MFAFETLCHCSQRNLVGILQEKKKHQQADAGLIIEI
jgi:hypothetical protein